MKTSFKLLAVITLMVLSVLPTVAMERGEIAVADLEKAILGTDFAQKELKKLAKSEDFIANKTEFEGLNKEVNSLLEDFQRDQAVMSEEQKAEVRRKIAGKKADIQYVVKKLRGAQQQDAQRVLKEIAPKAREVLDDIIVTEGIGLLLQQQITIHADVDYDITAKITDKLNQMLVAQ